MKKTSFGRKRLSMSTVERYNEIANEAELDRVGMDDWSDMNLSGAAGTVSAKSTEPYILQISNAGGAQENAIIFGRNRFSGQPNFGSGANVTITMGVASVPYEQLLQQSANEPFEIVKVRLSSVSVPQLDNSITYVKTDSNGMEAQTPITVTSYLSPDQFQSQLRDIDYRMQIDGNTHLVYPIEAGAAVTMSVYIQAKVNIAKPLIGKGAVTEFAKARIRSFSK
jgi:hypothetical protein